MITVKRLGSKEEPKPSKVEVKKISPEVIPEEPKKKGRKKKNV